MTLASLLCLSFKTGERGWEGELRRHVLESVYIYILMSCFARRRLRAFSSAKTVMSGGSEKKMTIVGTVSNMAPEMINAESQYSEAVDIYSLAVTLWEIWTVLVPFKDFNTFQIYKMVGEDSARPNLPKDMNEVYKSCVNAAWGQNPKFRPSASALHHTLCKEHDRLNASLNRVKAKWLKLSSKAEGSGESLNEEEQRMTRTFSMNMPEELPEGGSIPVTKDEPAPTDLTLCVTPPSLVAAFKVKSDSDKSTRTLSKEKVS